MILRKDCSWSLGRWNAMSQKERRQTFQCKAHCSLWTSASSITNSMEMVNGKMYQHFHLPFLDRKCYIFSVVALLILVLLQLIPLVYTQCLAIMEKIEIYII